MKRVFVGLVLLLFLACEKDLGPTGDGVRVTVSDESITIINGTDNELRFFPVNQDVLAALNWAPYCLQTGLIIAPGERETIAFVDIYGYQPDCKIVVHWWVCEEVDGKAQPGAIQFTVVSTAR